MKRDLWLRLKAYQFDGVVPPQLWDHVVAAFGHSNASSHAFASKLARKLGWSQKFARRAIAEYKKFVYLGVVSEFTVTPPKVIDQVWHEHLLFSKAYREFCRDVLQRDFDHNPEIVPSASQTAKYERQYDATLALYFAEFNMQPPETFWGQPKFQEGAGKKEPRRAASDPGTDGSGGVSTAAERDDAPLYALFAASGDSGSESHALPEFGGGGGFSGAGGGDDWSGDGAGGSDSSSDGGDGGGSDGGSGCSSGCGGE